ncbi:MAG: molybdopterin-dependent oxidoreductase [Pseudomonadota bacterium]
MRHPDAERPTASHWGTGRVRARDGRIEAVLADPADPDPSPINDNITGSLNGRARVLRPAIREGYLRAGPGPADDARGREPFVEVDWDRALDLIAAEMRRVHAAHGPEAIFGGSYGWASAGRFHHAQSQLKRFLGAAGGFVRSEGNYSYNAALVLMPHILGNFRHHVREATRLSTVAEAGRLVVMFGGLPLRNAQISGGGVGRHRLRGELEACRAAGVRFVNLSPLRSDAPDALGAEWLAPRPGTDTAVMMGLAHSLIEEGLHSPRFLRSHTVGFERLARYLLGDMDGVEKSADWAAALSGIDAERLRRLARDMAAGPTLITTAVGLQRADFGEQPLWMTVALAAMLGQIGLPGAGFGIGYAADASIGTMDRPVRWPALPMGPNPVETVLPVAMIADMLLGPGARYRYNGRDLRFPDTRLLWWAGGNPFHHHQDLNRLRQAFQRPETVIVNEINWTATARHADIVLPVAAPLERTDFAAGNQDNVIVPMPKMAEPPGEARTEYALYCALEQRLGLGTAFSAGRDEAAWLAHLWSEMQGRAAEAGHTLPEWESFLAGEAIELPDPAPHAVFLSAFRADPEQAPLPTPSGRIELTSEVIAGFGDADCPGQPHWFPPRGWSSGEAERFPLHMLSGQPATRLHSQHDNGALSRSQKIQGREPILMHPTDAAARGIAEGDVVTVFNDRGRCLAGARLTEDIRPGVVFLWTGAWYDPDFSDPDRLDRHGNPNVLTHDLRTSALSQGPASHSAFVEIAPIKGPPPPVEAFDPPPFSRGD